MLKDDMIRCGYIDPSKEEKERMNWTKEDQKTADTHRKAREAADKK